MANSPLWAIVHADLIFTVVTVAFFVLSNGYVHLRSLEVGEGSREQLEESCDPRAGRGSLVSVDLEVAQFDHPSQGNTLLGGQNIIGVSHVEANEHRIGRCGPRGVGGGLSHARDCGRTKGSNSEAAGHRIRRGQAIAAPLWIPTRAARSPSKNG